MKTNMKLCEASKREKIIVFLISVQKSVFDAYLKTILNISTRF